MPNDDYMATMQGDDGTLGSADLIAAYERGIDDLRAAVAGMTAEQVLARPVPGKWSTVECVGHLADTEVFFTDRIVRTVALDRPLLMSADEKFYIERLDYQSFDLAEQLALFTALRRHAARILRMQPPEAWSRTAVHSTSGLLTLRQLVLQAVRHLRHHLPFIAEKRVALGGPDVSMTPEQVAAGYDQIADRWLDVSTYGFAQIERAVAFAANRGWALDVGCGTGRLTGLLNGHGFRTDGIDVSAAMIGLARDRHPEARLVHADICRWELPRSYDLIVAWDSVWHVPLARQEAVLTKLCRGLSAGGVLVFTTGGTDAPAEKQDSCMGPPMYHATLGIPTTLRVLAEPGCVCRHLEYDQHPEDHVYVVAQNAKDDGPTTSGLVRLRNVERGDLPRVCQMQLDPESNRVAVTIPRTAEGCEAHWANVLRDPSVTAKAILLGEEMVGYVCCFGRDGRANVGYWVSREHWGKGIASRALKLLLLEVAARPLYAHAATSNGASLRVLRKCGFVVERVQVSPATDRYPECEEAVLVLTE